MPDSIEDAGGFDEEAGVAVIADGAGGGLDPQGWSQCLVDATLSVAAGSPLEQQVLIPDIVAAANASYRAPALEHYPKGIPVKPSGATIAVLRSIRNADGLWWSVEAVGDVNVLLHSALATPVVREDLVPGRYTSTPAMLIAHEATVPAISVVRPTYARPGDFVFLFSDGLGPWLVERCTSDVLAFLCAASPEEFADLIGAERAAKRMKRDDVMLIRCSLWTAAGSRATNESTATQY